MYFLQTYFLGNKSFLEKIETTLNEGLEQFCNVSLDADMRQQSSLPVKISGLGIMSATVINCGAYLSFLNKCKELIGKIARDASASVSEEEALSD